MVSTEFNLVRLDSGSDPTIAVYGELDLMTSPTLHAALTEIFEEHPNVVQVDLANVTFIDSSALGTLLVAHRHLHDQGGELRLVAVPPPVARVFELAGLSDRFNVATDGQEAASSSSPPAN